MNSRVSDTEEWISDQEDRLMGISQLNSRQEEKCKKGK